jgi:hypothetical protein
MLTVFGTSFSPYSLEATHTRAVLRLLKRYTVHFADLNQETVKAHLAEDLLNQSAQAEQLTR